MKLTDIHLVLFLSRATPLARWDKIGIYSRETAIYKRLSSRLDKISIVTSGGVEELTYCDDLKDIRILNNRWGLSPNVYSLLAPILHWRALRMGTIYKSNQLDGSWTAVLAGKLFGKPVLVRAGYPWGRNFREAGNQGIKVAVIDCLEALTVKHAHTLMLTTESIKQYIISKHRIQPDKIAIVPNYVDTELFRPNPDIKSAKKRVCFVGRLNPIKNLTLLIEAASQISGISLVLVGDGEQRKELESFAAQYGVKAEFRGVLPHQQIPIEINRSEVFILPSRYEGHPKALIEAMACGAAVIGTDVVGTQDVIQHEKTGLLCPPTVSGIKSSLHRLLADHNLRKQLGNEARSYTEREFSLNRIVEIETLLLQSIVDEDNK